jgi:hypothetical protein
MLRLRLRVLLRMLLRMLLRRLLRMLRMLLRMLRLLLRMLLRMLRLRLRMLRLRLRLRLLRVPLAALPRLHYHSHSALQHPVQQVFLHLSSNVELDEHTRQRTVAFHVRVLLQHEGTKACQKVHCSQGLR